MGKYTKTLGEQPVPGSQAMARVAGAKRAVRNLQDPGKIPNYAESPDDPAAPIRLLREAKRRRYRGSLFAFTKYCLDNPDLEVEAHGPLCQKLEEYYWGVGSRPDHEKGIRKLLIMMPRGSLKSTIATVAYPLWILMQNDPSALYRVLPDGSEPWSAPTSFNGKKGYNQRILISNAVDVLAQDFMRLIQSKLAANEELLDVFGRATWDKKTDGLWKSDQFNIAWRDDVRSREANVSVGAMNKAVNSGHYDICINDDMINEKYVNTQEMIERSIQFHLQQHPVLEKPSLQIYIGTHWHDADLYDYLRTHPPELAEFEYIIERAIRTDEEVEAGKRKIFCITKHSEAWLEKERELLGDYFFSCNTGEAPILMADWTLKPLRDVKVGDKVVGFTVDDKRRKLIESTVVANGSREAEVAKVTMADGHEIRCTLDHQWYSGRKDRKTYRRLHELKKLCRIVTIPKEENHGDWRYLAGIVDGEGSVKHGSILIFQSLEKNRHIAEEIQSTVDRLGVPNHRWVGRCGVSNGTTATLTIKGGRDVKLALNCLGRPAKRQDIADCILKKQPGGVVKERVAIASVKAGGVDTVYSMQTTSGNYVAWGYGSKNCQYQNDPIDQETAAFKKGYFENQVFQLPEVPDEKKRWLNSLNIYTSCDPAISKEKTGCKAVITTCGWDSKGDCYLLDVFAKKGTQPGELLDEFFRQYGTWNPLSVGIEEIGFQELYQWNAERISKERNVYLPWFELKPSGRIKDQRISRLEPLCRQKKFFYQSHQQDVVAEFLRWPRGKSKDIIDALAYQLDMAYSPAAPHIEAPEIELNSAHYEVEHFQMMLAKRREQLMGRGDGDYDWYND